MGVVAAITAAVLVAAAGTVKATGEYNAATAQKKMNEKAADSEKLLAANAVEVANARARNQKKATLDKLRIVGAEQENALSKQLLQHGGSGTEGGTAWEQLTSYANIGERNLQGIKYSGDVENQNILHAGQVSAWEHTNRAIQYNNQARALASSRQTGLVGNILQTGGSALAAYSMAGGTFGGASGGMTASQRSLMIDNYQTTGSMAR